MNFTEREIVRQTAGMVATALGEGWAVDTDPKWDDYTGVYLAGPDNVRIYLRVNEYRHEGKVTIGTAYPDGWLTVYNRDIEDPTIYVSRDRGPQVIAREITRRFLPKYLANLATLTERVDGHNAHEAGKADLAAELRALAAGPGMQSNFFPNQVHIPGAGRLDVQGPDYVYVESMTLSAEGARRFIALLQDLEKEGQS